MKTISFFNLLFILVMFSFISCGGSATKKESKTEEIADQLEEDLNESKEDIEKGIKSGVNALKEAMGEIEKAVTEANDGEKIEPVNFRELKKMIPEKFAGLPRTDNSGETTGAMGFKISKAEAKFRDGDKSVDLEIMDVAGVGIALLGMAAWTTLEIDKESDDGYERSTTFEGYKAYEKYNSKTGRGELNILVKNRFIVKVESRNVDMDDVKRQLRKMDVDDLEDLS